MENSHKPLMINPINNPQITTHAQWSRISSTNISLRFFFLFFCFFFFFFFLMNFHTLVINKSYSTKKPQGMNKHSQIIDEHMNLTHEITSQIEIFKSMSNDGVKGVI